jgi:sec-independent protein translocase protein TatC
MTLVAQFFRRSRLYRILTAPFRGLGAVANRIRGFFRFQPEETDIAELLEHTLEQPMGLLDHLDALRAHLLRMVLYLAATTAFSFTFARQLIDLIARPVGGINALRAIDVTEPVSVYMRVSLLSGLILALPLIVFEIYLFMVPGLTGRERMWGIIAIPAVVLFFVGGAAFTYLVLLPKAMPFLINFMGIRTDPRPSSYIQVATGMIFWIGVAFEFPLVIYLLASLGLVKARALARYWRIAIIVIAIAAAIITPTADPVNMGLVMLPLFGLYGLGILLAMAPKKGRT